MKPPFRFGTVEGGNTHETLKRNMKKMHNYIKNNGFFRANISAGVEAVKNESATKNDSNATCSESWTRSSTTPWCWIIKQARMCVASCRWSASGAA